MHWDAHSAAQNATNEHPFGESAHLTSRSTRGEARSLQCHLQTCKSVTRGKSGHLPCSVSAKQRLILNLPNPYKTSKLRLLYGSQPLLTPAMPIDIAQNFAMANALSAKAHSLVEDFEAELNDARGERAGDLTIRGRGSGDGGDWHRASHTRNCGGRPL